MTAANVKRIIDGLDIDSYIDVQTPELRTICMTTNYGIDPERDFITFDFSHSLIKIKKKQVHRNPDGTKYYTDYTEHLYDVYLDMNLIVGFELTSGKIGCS